MAFLLCFDIDGCIVDRNVGNYEDSKFFTQNQRFLERVVAELKSMNSPQRVIFAYGTNRLDYRLDKYTANRNKSYSCTWLLQPLHRFFQENLRGIEVVSDPFWLADLMIPQKKPKEPRQPGMSYFRAAAAERLMSNTERNEEKKLPEIKHISVNFFDAYKIVQMYARAHRLAASHSFTEQHTMWFFDDRDEILTKISEFFSAHSDLLPKNVTLRLVRHTVNNACFYEEKWPPIKGSGEVSYYLMEYQVAAMVQMNAGFHLPEEMDGTNFNVDYFRALRIKITWLNPALPQLSPPADAKLYYSLKEIEDNITEQLKRKSTKPLHNGISSSNNPIAEPQTNRHFLMVSDDSTSREVSAKLRSDPQPVLTLVSFSSSIRLEAGKLETFESASRYRKLQDCINPSSERENFELLNSITLGQTVSNQLAESIKPIMAFLHHPFAVIYAFTHAQAARYPQGTLNIDCTNLNFLIYKKEKITPQDMYSFFDAYKYLLPKRVKLSFEPDRSVLGTGDTDYVYPLSILLMAHQLQQCNQYSQYDVKRLLNGNEFHVRRYWENWMIAAKGNSPESRRSSVDELPSFLPYSVKLHESFENILRATEFMSVPLIYHINYQTRLLKMSWDIKDKTAKEYVSSRYKNEESLSADQALHFLYALNHPISTEIDAQTIYETLRVIIEKHNWQVRTFLLSPSAPKGIQQLRANILQQRGYNFTDFIKTLANTAEARLNESDFRATKTAEFYRLLKILPRFHPSYSQFALTLFAERYKINLGERPHASVSAAASLTPRH